MTQGRSRDAQFVAPREEGYALVAAVASILFFATVALGVMSLTQRAIVTGSAEVDAARASAAADAGVAMAIRMLLTDGPAGAVLIDGSSQTMTFDGAALAITISDERGKVPLNLLDEEQLTLLLEYIGLDGELLAIARDSFLDWIDDDDVVRPNGAEIDYYRERGLRPRNGGFLTLGEIRRVRGFSAASAEKIAAFASADFGNGSFDTRSASPAAIKIMYPDGSAAIAEIVRAREARGQVTALTFTDRASRVGRPISIGVVARYPSGGVAAASCVIELTGAARRPYVVRHCS